VTPGDVTHVYCVSINYQLSGMDMESLMAQMGGGGMGGGMGGMGGGMDMDGTTKGPGSLS
jgi:hypothetical protein